MAAVGRTAVLQTEEGEQLLDLEDDTVTVEEIEKWLNSHVMIAAAPAPTFRQNLIHRPRPRSIMYKVTVIISTAGRGTASSHICST